MNAHSSEKSYRLVGRENECHLAIGAVLVAQRNVGQALVFVGPRGMGKSALLEEIADRVEDLLTDPLICHARLDVPGAFANDLAMWAARLAAACLGERLSRAMRPASLAALASQASRRNESEVRRLADEASRALEAGSLPGLIEAVNDLARMAGSRTRLPIIFLLDDLEALIQADPQAAATLERVVARSEFTWIATASPDAEGRQPLLPAFRRSVLSALDLNGAAQILEALCARRGRQIPPEAAKPLAACLMGHGALSDAYARELALTSDPEPGLETHVRLLVDSLEQGSFAITLAAELRALFPAHQERQRVLEALCRLAEEDAAHRAPGGEPPLLADHAPALRALGLLDWQAETIAPTPLWPLRQLILMWRDQAHGGADTAGGRLWRCSETLRRMHALAPAGETELDSSTLAACLAALSGSELDAGNFTILPESVAPSGRIRLPMAIAAEPLNASATIARFSASPPNWIAMAGMLGLMAVEDPAASPSEMAFWVLAAFSPPVAVNEDDVRHVRQLAESLALDAVGVRPAGVWIVAGEFRPSAERVAEIEGVMLTSWSAWRELNALPMPTPEQLEAEAPPLFDPSGLGFALELACAEDNPAAGAEPAVEAAQTLAERIGFSDDQCREIAEAVRRSCQWALQRSATYGAGARVRARLEDQTLMVAIEHEAPRWRHAAGESGYAPDGTGAWDLAPLRSRMDDVLSERLPWGHRLFLRKRLDPFAQLT